MGLRTVGVVVVVVVDRLRFSRGRRSEELWSLMMKSLAAEVVALVVGW